MSEYANRTRFAAGVFLLFVGSAFFSGCSREPEAEAVAVSDSAPVGTTTKYDWYMQGTTPAGHSTITKTGDGETWSRSNENQRKMLKKLFDNGVQLVPGSDNIAAFTIHRELEVYVEAGIPEAAVLRMATLDSAGVVGVDDRTGSIAVGKDADLILLDGNPLNDISAVRRAMLVVKGNNAYRPDELYKVVGVEPFLASMEL